MDAWRLQEVLTDSLAMDWTPAQSLLLQQIEGTESVVQAVARVQRMSQVHPSPQCSTVSDQMLEECMKPPL